MFSFHFMSTAEQNKNIKILFLNNYFNYTCNDQKFSKVVNYQSTLKVHINDFRYDGK